jgi:hypothetical protein
VNDIRDCFKCFEKVGIKRKAAAGDDGCVEEDLNQHSHSSSFVIESVRSESFYSIQLITHIFNNHLRSMSVFLANMYLILSENIICFLGIAGMDGWMNNITNSVLNKG